MDRLKPSKNLRQNIVSGIAREEYRQAKIYLLMSSLAFTASLAGVILSLKYLIKGFYESGFYQYLSLLFSGDSLVLNYLKELSYSLIETLPILEVAAFLTALGFLIWSGISIITNTHRFILRTN